MDTTKRPTLRELKTQAAEMAKLLPDAEYIRVVRTAKRMFEIQPGIGRAEDGTVWIVSGKEARKGWYAIA